MTHLTLFIAGLAAITGLSVNAQAASFGPGERLAETFCKTKDLRYTDTAVSCTWNPDVKSSCSPGGITSYIDKRDIVGEIKRDAYQCSDGTWVAKAITKA